MIPENESNQMSDAANTDLVTVRDNAHVSLFYDDLKTHKVGQVSLVFGFWSGLIRK